jgi:hypothetical protein
LSRNFRRAARSRRSLVLLLFGVLYVLIGASYIGLEDQITSSPFGAQSYHAQLALMPLDGWSLAFIGTGVAGLLGGLTGRQPLGFGALVVMASAWGVEFIASWVTTGYDRAAIAALMWVGLAAALCIIAGWPDPHEVRIVDLFDWIDRQ